MFTLAISMLLYVAGFVFLYGVIRVAVRHALEDLDVARSRAAGAERSGSMGERSSLRENAFLGGS